MTNAIYATVDHVLVNLDTDFDMPSGASLDDLADAVIEAIQAVADCSVDVRYRSGLLHSTVTAVDANGDLVDSDSIEALVREVSGAWWVRACQAAE